MRDLAEIMRNRTPVISVFQELGDALGECLLYEHLHKDGDPRRRKPVEDVIRLVLAADELVGQGKPDSALRVYRLAVAWGLNPKVQAELGHLLLERAGLDSLPLCEHDTDPGSDNWDPDCWVHCHVGGGPRFPGAEGIAEVALQAFSRVWAFHHQCGVYESAFLSGLLALDGMRVAAEALDDIELLSAVYQEFQSWLNEQWEYGEQFDEHDAVVRPLEIRFGETKGRLEPIMVGRSKALERLRRELRWFDTLPIRVQDYLGDAEYMRAQLKDPSYNPKGIVAMYCIAVEAMLQWRLGEVVDTYLKGAPKSEADSFRSEFLQSKNKEGRVLKEWRCAELAINAFAKHIKRARFKNVLSEVGADSQFVFRELPSHLSNLLAYRNPASHAHKRLFTEEGVSEARGMVMHVIENLNRLVSMLTQRESQDG